MKIRLAGYNVNADILNELVKKGIDADLLSPEIISAAYARISRSPLTIEELRKTAAKDVSKARKSNKTIVFDMGHSSIAEHAVFNIDIENVSRLVLEEIEKHRFASYTEKSQRYVKLGSDFMIPSEISGSEYEKDFIKLQKKAADLYLKMTESGIPKEDARYFLPMSMTGQVGMTLNTRTLEHMILALSASTFSEAGVLGKKLYEETSRITPSLIRYITPNKYHRKEYSIGFSVNSEQKSKKYEIPGQNAVYYRNSSLGELKLISAPENMDLKIAKMRLERLYGENIDENQLNQTVLNKTFDEIFDGMSLHDAAPREFEHFSFTWNIICSAGAFAQLKRHRLAGITWSAYNPAYGFTVPSTISGKFHDEIKEIINLSNRLFFDIQGNHAQYALLSGHRKKVTLTMNLREHYHFSRLREDSHAQWDIRAFAFKMHEILKEYAPLSTKMLGGKDILARDLNI